VGDVETAQVLTAKYPAAWQAWLLLAAAHGSRHQSKASTEALDRARSLGFRGIAPTPTIPSVAAPY
jgi:hypothetical protein